MKVFFVFISPLFEYAVKYSPATISFFYMVFHFSLFSLLLFLVGLIFAISVSVLMSLLHDLKSTFELRNFLEEYNHYEFRSIELKNVFSEETLSDLKCMLRIYKNKLVNCYEPLLKDKSIRKRFCGFRAFPNMIGESTIFLSNISTEMNIETKFKLFHEIGHLSKGHYEIVSLKNISFTNYMIFLFMIAIVSVGNPYIISLSFVSTIFYAINIDRLFDYSIGKLESVADIFAMAMIRDENDYKDIVAYLKDKKIVDTEIMDYCSWWIEDYVDMTRMRKPFSKLGTTSFNKMLTKTLSDKAVNYYSLIEKLSMPPIVSVILFFIVIVISSFFASVNIPISSMIILICVLSFPVFLIIMTTISLIVLIQNNVSILKRNGT